MAILKDKSKKKKGENIIGKIIYGFLLFMPLIAVGVACLYVVLNKNAYESYSTDKVQNATKVNNDNLLITNNTYSFNLMNVNPNGIVITPVFKYKETTVDWSIFGAPDNYNYDSFSFRTGNATANKFLFLYENGVQVYETHTGDIDYFNTRLPFTFVLDSYTSGTTGWTSSFDVSLLTISNTKLDNVFYYQMEKLEESDLFNWTKNTGAYTVMHNVTSGIGITNTYTPMLMSYWLLISVIYFIFDIALILVWAVHDKIHELKDAI